MPIRRFHKKLIEFALTTQHPLTAKVGTNFVDKRR
jgi:hypothetical protein